MSPDLSLPSVTRRARHTRSRRAGGARRSRRRAPARPRCKSRCRSRHGLLGSSVRETHRALVPVRKPPLHRAPAERSVAPAYMRPPPRSDRTPAGRDQSFSSRRQLLLPREPMDRPRTSPLRWTTSSSAGWEFCSSTDPAPGGRLRRPVDRHSAHVRSAARQDLGRPSGCPGRRTRLGGRLRADRGGVVRGGDLARLLTRARQTGAGEAVDPARAAAAPAASAAGPGCGGRSSWRATRDVASHKGGGKPVALVGAAAGFARLC
jgi:hypothetical protein